MARNADGRRNAFRIGAIFLAFLVSSQAFQLHRFSGRTRTRGGRCEDEKRYRQQWRRQEATHLFGIGSDPDMPTEPIDASEMGSMPDALPAIVPISNLTSSLASNLTTSTNETSSTWELMDQAIPPAGIAIETPTNEEQLGIPTGVDETEAIGPASLPIVSSQPIDGNINTTQPQLSRRHLFVRGTVLLGAGLVISWQVVQAQERAALEAQRLAQLQRQKAASMIPSKIEFNANVSTNASTIPAAATGAPANATVQLATDQRTAAANSPIKTAPAPATTSSAATPAATLEPVNLTKVASETNINVTLLDGKEQVFVDPKSLTKVKVAIKPTWFPAFLSPQPQIVKTFPDFEIMEAAIVAGSVTEMVRTSVLYPVQTVKTRIQTDIHNVTLQPPPVEQRLQKLAYNVQRHTQEGNLYAGIVPSLLVSVPATGVYYGTRDISKRMLSMLPINDVTVALTAASIADVISLAFRTPADALALRLQNQDDEGNWIRDGLQRLPAVVLTDLPYLVTKIALNRVFIQGHTSIDRYIEGAIAAAIIAAFVTTPFDVARTRILIDSDGGSMGNVADTMHDIMKEGDGGVANLFAGWLERTLYLGIGRAWLEPFAILGYAFIRDAVLLKWL